MSARWRAAASAPPGARSPRETWETRPRGQVGREVTNGGLATWQRSGQTLRRGTADRGACVVMLAGRAGVSAGSHDFGTIGGRASPFGPDPWSLYVPARSDWSLTAEGACEVALCTAP